MLTLSGLVFALAVESGLIVICLVGLVALRVHMNARTRAVDDGVRALEPVIHAWLIRGTHARTVVRLLRRQPPYVAFRSLARLTTPYLTPERQHMLAPLLRREPWVKELLRHGRSPLWWRRFDAARLLSIVAGEADGPLVASMLQDRNRAVRLVAIDAAARLGGQLVELELDRLPERQDAVQAYQLKAFARHPRVVTRALVPRLVASAEPRALSAYVDAAAALASPEALTRVCQLATHPIAEVRVHVARALRRHADPDSVPALVGLLADADWRVRAQAARALGALRVHTAVPLLAAAVRDRSWWVRYRSALALAQIGGQGRDTLLEVARGDDALARDMSILVAELSPAAVVEMSEV